MKIATIQLAVNDKESLAQRLANVEDIFEEIAASAQRPDLILLPEIWGCGFFDFDDYEHCAEPLDGRTFTMLSHWAKQLQCWKLGGSIIERRGGKLHNTSLLVDRTGALVGIYRKMHLFGYESYEQKILTRGEEPTVLDTEFGKIGLSTCYDLRFPEQYRAMVDRGAELLLVVSAWPEARLVHWRIFNQVRAVENQCWVVSCNCAGVQKGSRYAGHSMTVDPAGVITAEAGDDECIQWSEIDLTAVDVMRDVFPALADRVHI